MTSSASSSDSEIILPLQDFKDHQDRFFEALRSVLGEDRKLVVLNSHGAKGFSDIVVMNNNNEWLVSINHTAWPEKYIKIQAMSAFSSGRTFNDEDEAVEIIELLRSDAGVLITEYLKFFKGTLFTRKARKVSQEA